MSGSDDKSAPKQALDPNSKPAALMLLKLTLYDDNNEVVEVYERAFIPWGLLKRAKNLMQYINQDNPADIPDDVFDGLASLVVETFGNKFTVEDLNKYSDVEEMITVLMQIISKATGLLPANPTRPG